MKIACEIIRDLIPLYVDNSLSDVSRKAVEEHLEECEDCHEYLKEVQAACRELDAGKTKEDFMAEAGTLRKAKRTMQKKKIITIVLSIIVSVIVILVIGYGIVSSMTETYLPVTDTDLISIQYDNEGNLVADIEGPVVMRTKILNLELEDNGRTVNCLVFGAWTTKWEQVHSGKNEFSRMLLAYADKGAAQIDRVYYLAPDIETADEQFGSTSYAVSTSDLTDAQLIYETPESLNFGLVDEDTDTAE